MTEQWTLLWSKKQNEMRIERIEDWLSKNRKAYRDDAHLDDFHAIYIGSRETCQATADAVRFTIGARGVGEPVGAV